MARRRYQRRLGVGTIDADAPRIRTLAGTTSGGGSGAAPSTALYLTLATSVDLTSERVLTPGTGIAGVDAGAGGAYTLSVNQSFTPTWTGAHVFGSTVTLSTMTEGSVFFAGAGGVINEANANLFYDAAQNYFGLGINAALAARLHVAVNTADDPGAFFQTLDDDTTESLTEWRASDDTVLAKFGAGDATDFFQINQADATNVVAVDTVNKGITLNLAGDTTGILVINVDVQVRETIMEATVTGAAGDLYRVYNSTSSANIFAPGFVGHTVTSDKKASILFLGSTDSSHDTGSFPLVRFNAWKVSDGQDPTNPAAGGTQLITSRRLFGFFNNATELVSIDNDGRLGVVETSPLAQVHIDQPNASATIPALWTVQTDVSEQHWHLALPAATADRDIRILTLGVDGAPEFGWLETANVFNLSHGLTVETGIVTITNTGLHLLDTDASHDLVIRPGSNLTADRTLSLTTGDADRTITLTGSPTLDDWFNQNVKTNGSPTFSGVTVSGLIASTVVYSGAAKALTSLANGGGYLTNDGAGALSWSAGAIPAAHAATHANGGGDAVDHDTLTNYDANDHIDHTTITLTAGDGLTGGGTIAANRTFTVGAGDGITVNANDVALTTPGTLTAATGNAAAGNHTHAITTTADGETNPSTILAANASGRIRLSAIGIGVATGAANQITIVDGGTIGKAGGPLLTFNDTGNFLTLAGAWAGFGTATPLGQIDAMQAGSQFSLIVGADVSAQSRTNATRKFARIGMPHYTNAEEPFSLLVGDSDGSGNILSVGGGTSVANAATTIIFYTAANDTTVTGTARARITSAGRLAVGVTAPLARAHFDQFDPDIGIPALLLDQSDVSEQCIKFSSDGVDRDIHLFTINVGGAPGMDWDESQNAIDFINMSGITIEADSFYGWGDQTVRIEGHHTNDTMDFYTQNALAVSIDNAQTVAMGLTAAGLATLHIRQNTSGGSIPALYLHQIDVSEEFARFQGTAAAGVLTQSIVDEGDQASETREGWIKVFVVDDGGQITDQAYYVPIYTLSA